MMEHTESAVSVCTMCGAPLIGPNLIYDTELQNTYCHKCFPYIRTCQNCKDGSYCDFQTNESPLPKQVQMTRRSGNTVVSQVVQNPDRIKITCENGCPCYSSEFGCVKEFCMQDGFCPNNKWSIK